MAEREIAVDVAAHRERLLTVARDYGHSLTARPPVRGLVLYGSLARGGVTLFSDVDLVAVYEGKLPEHTVEHRLVDGVKVDLIFARRSDVLGLTQRLPYHLFSGNAVPEFLIESLLLGGEDTLLFDPTGEIAQVRAELRSRTSYEEIALPAASEFFDYTVRGSLAPAVRALEHGEFAGAMRSARSAGRDFAGLLRMLTAIKDPATAAAKLGIPRFASAAAALEQLCAPGRDEVELLWQASKATWERSLALAYEPIVAALVEAGVSHPEKLDLLGEYHLFWPGYRIHELGRVIAEVELSLRWSRFELDRGNADEARTLLGRCRESSSYTGQWRRLGAALKANGHDVSAHIERLLYDASFVRLAAELDAANERAEVRAVTAPDAEAAVRLAEELRTLLAGAFPLMSPRDVSLYEAARACDSASLARALARLEEVLQGDGEPQAFTHLCGELRQRREREGRGAGGLMRWHLEVATGAPEEEQRRPSGSSSPPHLFSSSPLHPRADRGGEEGWEWSDPGGRARWASLPEGGVEIRMTGACHWDGPRPTAPALLREVTGDFRIETSVAGTGGLLITRGDGDHVRLGRHSYLKDEIWFEARVAGDEAPVSIVIGRGKLAGEPLWLRLSRDGSRFRARCSAGGREWFDLGALERPLEGPLRAGVYAVGWASDAHPVEVRFGTFFLDASNGPAQHAPG